VHTAEVGPSVQSQAAGFTLAFRPEFGLQFRNPSVMSRRKLYRWMVDPNPAFAAT